MGSPKLKIACLLVAAACSKNADEPPPAPTSPGLRVKIAAAETIWSPAAIAVVPHHAVANTGGDARDTWSLKDLAHAKVGATARVISVTGSDGTRTIDAAEWARTDQTPVLHVTRRGGWKFRYEDASGKWGPGIVNDVTAIEITP